MARFLIFQLYGPLASWGEVAVGEIRPSAPHPTRSAILGIAGAAVGIQRDDLASLAALSEGIAVACELRAFGSNLRDYHTAQTLTQPQINKAAKAGLRVMTRRDELAFDGLKTILSSREYRQNSFARATLLRREGSSAPSLEVIENALRQPRFIPYLGRRSCPAGLPFAPAIAEADSLVAALDSQPLILPKELKPRFQTLFRQEAVTHLYWDEDVPAGLDPIQVFDRRDDPSAKVARGFRVRREFHATRVARREPCSFLA